MLKGSRQQATAEEGDPAGHVNGNSRQYPAPFRICVITTGGTIAKTYDPIGAVLQNRKSDIVGLIRSLRVEGAKIAFRHLMNKDSLDLDDDDRARIVATVRTAARKHDAVVVIHGTDSVTKTAETLLACAPDPAIPIVFTGAMIPCIIRGSDGPQNVTEALFACRLLPRGVYLVFHGRALAFPGVEKDYEALTFVPTGSSETAIRPKT